MTPIEELTALVDALRAETTEQSITPERMGAILQRMIDVLPSVSDANSLKGWLAISSINELPTSPSPSQQALAYLLDTTLYVYVGSGGDTLEGKYRSAELKGTKGDTGNAGGDGQQGPAGKSAYQSYFDTTQDNPKKTEAEWASSLLGGAAIVNNLESDSEVDALAAAMGKRLKELLNDTAAPTEIVSIPFDGGGRYIKADGSVAANNAWISTPYVAVNEGDEFVYSGTPHNTSRGVAGYAYDDANDTYTFVTILIPASISALTDKLIIIPSGVTHILAVDRKSGNASLTTTKRSTLSNLTDSLGDVSSTTLIEDSDECWHSPMYIKGDGYVMTSTGRTAIFDVEINDVIELYDYNPYGKDGAGEANISKVISETKCEPLLVLESGTKEYVSYKVTESMTIAVSCYRSGPRMLVVRKNKIEQIDTLVEGLKDTREEVANALDEIDKYDIKLGCMFENIAVIGDSMSRGTLGAASDADLDNDGTGFSSFGASWLSCLAKRWNCKSKFHYANSGTDCHGWLNNSFYGLGRFLADIANGKIYNAYFIAYGHNDAPSAGVGTAEDEAAPVTITEGVPSCPSGYTFCAYYKALINQIRTNAPHAMIFCLSEYDNVLTGKPKSQAIIDVADWCYNNGDKLVHHLETGGVPDSAMSLGTHYSTVGYAYIAKRVDNEVNRVVYQYRADGEIKNFGSYNTDHNADSPWE